MVGGIQDLEVDSSSEEEYEDDDEDQGSVVTRASAKQAKSGGMFSLLK